MRRGAVCRVKQDKLNTILVHTIYVVTYRSSFLSLSLSVCSVLVKVFQLIDAFCMKYFKISLAL